MHPLVLQWRLTFCLASSTECNDGMTTTRCQIQAAKPDVSRSVASQAAPFSRCGCIAIDFNSARLELMSAAHSLS
ncbi:hypothetical protein V8C26DRAFT_399629 [Trichoderma gracile]